MNEEDGVLPPEQLQLEDQIQLLEAEMDMVHQHFYDEEETWQRSTNELKENWSGVEDDMSMSEKEDMTMSEDVGVSIQNQMKAEEESIHMLHKDIAPTEAKVNITNGRSATAAKCDIQQSSYKE